MMQEFERPEYIFEEESEHTFLMLRLLTILSMPQTTVEKRAAGRLLFLDGIIIERIFIL